jgi:hypothetical protein
MITGELKVQFTLLFHKGGGDRQNNTLQSESALLRRILLLFFFLLYEDASWQSVSNMIPRNEFS